MFNRGGKESSAAIPSVNLSADAIDGIMECISKPIEGTNKRGMHPGQLVLAIQRVQEGLNTHPLSGSRS